MASSSILGGSKVPADISGKDVHALGPSDNSDSGSDAIGAYGDEQLSSDSDAAGTGERASPGAGQGHPDADILPDHIERAPGAGADPDLDPEGGDDFDDLSEVDDLADDLDDLDLDIEDGDGDGEGPGRSR